MYKPIKILVLFFTIIETVAIGLGTLFLHVITAIEQDISTAMFLQKAKCIWTASSIIWGIIGVLSLVFIGIHVISSTAEKEQKEEQNE